MFISDKLSNEGKRTGNYQTVTFAKGSDCLCPEVLIHIITKYISGEVKALIMNNPFADLVIGNVGHVQNIENKNTFQGVETRAMNEKRQTEKNLQRNIEVILNERKS